MKHFLYTSRRRHTRWTGDWSSDVCSSDLLAEGAEPRRLELPFAADLELIRHPAERLAEDAELGGPLLRRLGREGQIGRASCRERVQGAVRDGPGAIDNPDRVAL